MNILFPEQSVLSGAAYYRIYQPMFCLADINKDVQAVCLKREAKDKMKNEELDRLMWGTDIEFIYFPGSPIEGFDEINSLPGYNKFRVKNNRAPLAYVVDVDDWLYACNPFNESYIVSGTVEKIVHFDNGETDTHGNKLIHEKAWFNGDEHNMGGTMIKFDTERNKLMMDAKTRHIKAATAVTCTTEALAEKMRTLNPNVYVLPNAVDPTLCKVLPKVEREIRIGYAYSASHCIDWLDIVPTLKKFINKTPFVKLVLMGDKPDFRGFELDKIEHHPYVNLLNGYHNEFSKLRLDIGLMPLFDDEFNACKSPIKFLEYSCTNTASLCPQKLYGDYVKDGETAMVYKNMEDFIEKLKALVLKKELRERIADNARRHVIENYDIRIIAPKYYDTFEKIISKGVENEKNFSIAV